VGKFASLLGYEVDDRPANLNITYGYDYAFVTTHQTGVKFYYPVNDIVELQLAVSNGSSVDTSIDPAPGVNGFSDGYGVTGTINIKNSGGNANLFNGVYYSDSTLDGFTIENEGVLLWNTWGNWAPKFANDKLLLGFSSTLGDVSDAIPDVIGTNSDSYTFWTASLYAKYQFTDIFSLAGRASYFHSIDNTANIITPFELNGDAWSWTCTAGFDLLENLMLRAEYRVDIFDNLGDGAGGELIGESAQTIALQAVYTF
jgi:hypothetical protein